MSGGTSANVDVFSGRWPRRIFGLRLMAVAALLVVFYASEWTMLRLVVRASTAAMLTVLGHTAIPANLGSELSLIIGDASFVFTSNCTYAALFLVLIPLSFRRRYGWGANLRNVFVLAGAVFLANVVRIAFALHFHETGFAWWAVHDVPDVGIQTAVIVGAALAALEADTSPNDAAG